MILMKLKTKLKELKEFLENESHFIELKNKSGLDIVLSAFGAGVYSLKIDGERMILEPNDYLTYKFSSQFFKFA